MCVRRLPVTKNGLLGLPSANHCLGPLLTPQPATNTLGLILLKMHNFKKQAPAGFFIELLPVLIYVVNDLVVYFVSLKVVS